MDRIVTIGRCQWRAFWRRFKRTGNLNAGNQAIILIVSFLLLIRYLHSLQAAATLLPRGDARLFQSLFSGIFLVWLFPMAGNAGMSITTRKLMHLPLTLKELFGIRVVTLFIPPYVWIIVLGSLGICYPIIRAQNPVPGVIAALLFITFSALTGLTVSQLLTMKLWRRILFLVLLIIGFGVFYLISKGGVASVLILSSSLPPALVSRAALGQQGWVAVGELALLVAAALAAALWSFRQSLGTIATQRSRRFNFTLPGRIGGLAAKDFRYFRRLLDPYLGVLAAALGSVYLAVAQAPSATLLQLCILIVFLPNTPLAFNSFGLDNSDSLNRIKLMPVTGKTVLLGKNLAFLLIIGVQLLPLIGLGVWRLGLVAALLACLTALALAAMFLTWGNWMSLSYPVKMQFFQFSSSNGLIVEAIAGLLFGSLPGVIAIYLMQTQGTGAAWKLILMLSLSFIIYFAGLAQFSRRFEQKQDRILNAIS